MKLLICMITLSLTCWAVAQAAEPVERAAPATRPATPVPANVTAHRDLNYRDKGDARQSLDLFIPDGVKNPPLVVFIHGGSWRAGSKDRCPAMSLTEHGFAVASINYRLSTQTIFPAQISDCRAAIRYLRQHAREYGYDPDRIGVWGNSAGGHLAALLGTGANVKELDGDNPDTQGSCAVQAVADLFGPTEFLVRPTTGAQKGLFGGDPKEKKDLATLASPIAHIHPDTPPFLIVHGDKDAVVPIEQSQLLVEKLKAAKVDVKFEPVPGGGHGVGGPKINETIRQFFETKLAAKND